MPRRDHGVNRALVLGLLCLPIGLLGPFAALSGWHAYTRIRAQPDSLTGEASALFAIAAGLLATTMLVAGIIYFLAASRG